MAEEKQNNNEAAATPANEPEPISVPAPAPLTPAPAAEAEADAPAAAASPAPAAVQAEEAETPAPPPAVDAGRRKRSRSQAEQYHGLGRRKTSTARVLLRPGAGHWSVNGRTLEDYFPRSVLRQVIEQPLAATETAGSFDIKINVDGGGQRGQAEAVRLGLARALLEVDEDYRSRLRAAELLTRDAREVERKKPGRPKARKRFQFSKR